MFQCSKKVEDALVTLKNAQAHLHNQDEIGKAIGERSEFTALVIEAQEIVESILHQVKRYAECNAVKKKFVEGDVRKKIKTQVMSLGLKINTIESNHIQSIMLSQKNMIAESQAKMSELVQSLAESMANLQDQARSNNDSKLSRQSPEEIKQHQSERQSIQKIQRPSSVRAP